MALGLGKNEPVVWSDIDNAIVAGPHGEVKIAYNIASVRDSIENILGTAQGERVMLPQFGANLKNMLFEPVDSVTTFALGQLQRTIEQWDNRVTISVISATPYPDQNFVDVTMQFQINGSATAFTETFRF